MYGEGASEDKFPEIQIMQYSTVHTQSLGERARGGGGGEGDGASDPFVRPLLARSTLPTHARARAPAVVKLSTINWVSAGRRRSGAGEAKGG